LLEVFRMYKGLSLTPFCRFFTLSPVTNTRGHSAKVLKNRCSLYLRRFFFSERVVDRCNSLPQHVIDSGSINAFKNGLNTMRRDSMGFIMDWLGPSSPTASHVSEDPLEQVRPHLVRYLVRIPPRLACSLVVRTILSKETYTTVKFV